MAPDSPPTDYTAKTVKQLRATLATRGVSHKDLKLKAELITAVQESDIFKRNWVDPKWSVFFQRDFKADSSRRSFLDLPVEVRVMIYRQIFDHPFFHHPALTGNILQIEYAPHSDHISLRNERTEKLNDLLNTMIAFQCFNRAIRKESRPVFWSRAPVTIAPRYKHAKTNDLLLGPSYMAAFEQFLRVLGVDGRYGIKSLAVVDSSGCLTHGARPLGFSEAGHVSFKSACRMLLDCTYLTTLRLTVSELYLFQDDEEALKGFFNRGEMLKSRGLDAFRQTLQALPKLQDVRIDIPKDGERQTRADWQELTPFLKYVFTDERRMKLWVITKAILQGTKLQSKTGLVHVNFAGAFWFWVMLKQDTGMPQPGLSKQSDAEFVFSKCQSKLGEYDDWLAGTNSESGHRRGRVYEALTRAFPI
jgi:hypothetical protein